MFWRQPRTHSLLSWDLQMTWKEVHHSFATIADPKAWTTVWVKRLMGEPSALSLKFFFARCTCKTGTGFEYISDLQLLYYFTDEYFTWQYLDLDPPRRWQNGRKDSLSISQIPPVRNWQTINSHLNQEKPSMNLQTIVRTVSHGASQNVHQANEQAIQLQLEAHKINPKETMFWRML